MEVGRQVLARSSSSYVSDRLETEATNVCSGALALPDLSGKTDAVVGGGYGCVAIVNLWVDCRLGVWHCSGTREGRSNIWPPGVPT